MTTPPAGGDPTHVGRFEVRDRLRGGTPRLYRGYDPRFDREITLQLWPGPADDATAEVDRLIRRNRAALELRHPAILPVYEVGQADGWCYVAGASADGPRLAEVLADEPMPIRRAAVITQELADGLACAHERGFVHGAVHPSDVVLTEDGGAAWLDFGVHADAPPQNPAYAAPERLGDPPGPADTASDQYGLGVLLYAMLTGDPPFTGDDEEVVAQVLSTDKAPSPRKGRRDVPPPLDAICRQTLAPDPADRYRTAGELANDLRRFLDGAPVAARAPGMMESLRRKRGLVLVGLLLLLAGLGAVGGVGFWFLRVREARQMALVAQMEAMAAREQAEAARQAELAAREKAEKEQATVKNRQSADAKARSQAEKDRDQARDKVASLEARLKTEKQKAEDARKDVVDERNRLERTLYAQLVAQSQRAWNDHDPARARALLDAGKPADKRPDLRGWEWFFLQRQFRPPETFTFKAEESRIAGSDPHAGDGTDLRRAVCAYHPNGNLIALALLDDRVSILNGVVGGVALTMEGHEGIVCDLAYSPDGKLLATAGADKLVRLWDPVSGEAIRQLKGHDDAVTAVVFSPDGQTVAGGGADHTIILWESAGANLHTLKGHEAAVLAVAFSPDGKVLASADAAGTVRLWDVKAGEAKTNFTAHAGAVNGLAFAPDGQKIATCGDDRLVKLWDAHGGQEQRVLSGSAKALRSVAFRPDGQRIAAAGDDLTVSQWDLATGRHTAFATGHTARIQRIAYRPDGKLLATASADRTLKIWDADNPPGPDDRRFRQPDAVNAAAISPDGRKLVTAGQDKLIRLWDTRSGEVTRTFTGHTAAVRAVALSTDGRTLLSGGDDKAARLWDVATGQVQRTLPEHKDAILAVALSPDGKTMVTASKDGTARVRETATGQAQLTLGGHFGAVVGVQFSQDGKRILTTGADGSARSWDVETGRELASVTDRADPTRLIMPPGVRRRDAASRAGAYPARAIYKPGGNAVAFACRDGSIVLYDTRTALPTLLMEGHDGLIRCLAFSPDGRRLATGDGEGTVKLWDVRTGSELLSLSAHDGAVNGVTFSPDGQFLYTAGGDHAVRVWDGSPPDGERRPVVAEDEEGEKP
jgi:WD40 repeat protein